MGNSFYFLDSCFPEGFLCLLNQLLRAKGMSARKVKHIQFFDTSFTGKDQLRTRLRAGNFDNTPFGGDGVNLTALDVARTLQGVAGTP